MFDKIQLVETPFGSLRIWLYWNFNEDNKYQFRNLALKSDLANFLKVEWEFRKTRTKGYSQWRLE
jgi:hypothetical protein